MPPTPRNVGVTAVVFNVKPRAAGSASLRVPFRAGAHRPRRGHCDGSGSQPPVVAYDRRGTGKPEFDGQAQTVKHVAGSLHALLSEIGAAPPYMLVSHSYGGVLIMTLPGSFPYEVTGLV